MTKFDQDLDKMLGASQDVYQIAKPLFSETPVRYLHHYEISADGTCYLLISNQQLYLDWIDQDLVQPTVVKLAEQPSIQGFKLGLSDEWNYVDEFMASWHLGSACEYTYQKKGKIYLTEFFGAIDDTQMNDFYLNNTDILRYFTNYLVEQLRDLKPELTPLRINPVEKAKDDGILTDPNSRNLSIPKFLLGLSKSKRLSAKQKEVVYWYLKGKTVDETALILNVKSSTVDTQLKRIKAKLDCRTKPQIIYELLKDGLAIDDLMR